MKTGKITAKLRDAVPVCLMVEGEEVKRYKNIELPEVFPEAPAEAEDTSNNGYYHNMKFKSTAEAHGLRIEKHQKYGWTITTLATEAEAWVKETLGDEAINASRLPEGGSDLTWATKCRSRQGTSHNQESERQNVVLIGSRVSDKMSATRKSEVHFAFLI